MSNIHNKINIPQANIIQSDIILSNTKQICIFENCKKESTLNNYCKRHWCLDEHPTNQKKYKGYCTNCFNNIMKDNKKYLHIIGKH
jgi:hypothetical protein